MCEENKKRKTEEGSEKYSFYCYRLREETIYSFSQFVDSFVFLNCVSGQFLLWQSKRQHERASATVAVVYDLFMSETAYLVANNSE